MKKRTFIERLLAIALSVVLLVALFPTDVLVAHAAVESGTVTAVTEGLAVSEIDTDGKATVTAAERLALTYQSADSTIGRAGGWYVGVKIAAPEGLDTTDAIFDCYRHSGSNSEDVSFDENKDIPGDAACSYITMWALITETDAKSGSAITYRWNMDWDGNGSDDLQVTLDLDPAKLILLDQKGGQVFPATVETETDNVFIARNYENGAVTADISGIVELNKVAANDNIGRAEGWYIDIKITAPHGQDTSKTVFDCERATGVNNYGVSFDENKDVPGDASCNYITMWALISEEMLAEGGDVVYKWTVDWNGDGSKVLPVTLTVDLDKVILNDEDGNRVYPSVYATLDSDPEGVVTGAGTDNTVITVSGASIDYDVDREGWFVDVTVHFPAHITEAKEGENVLTGTEKTYSLELEPTWSNRQGKYIYTIEEDELTGTFYWDGVQQQLTLKVEDITLNQLKQDTLEFSNAGPVNLVYGTTGYQNAIVKGGNTGEITYSSSDTSIATVDKTGKITINSRYRTGTVTITATSAGDKVYQEATASYTLNIVNGSSSVVFQYPAPADFVFGTDNNVFTNAASYSTWTGSSSDGIKYEVVKNAATGADPDVQVATVNGQGVLTILHTGTVTIKASKTSQWGMDFTPATYTLNVIPGEQALKFEDPADKLTYDEEISMRYPTVYVVSGYKVADPVFTAVSSDPAVATAEVVDGQIIVTPVASGVFTLTVEVAGDDNYNAGQVSMEITVLAEQSTMAFRDGTAFEVTYNDNGNTFENPVENAKGNGDLSYASSDDKVATVDGNGTVTILKSGTVTITATKAGDTVYDAKSITYTLTISKADQKISFTEADAAAAVVNSAGSYTIGMNPTENWYNDGENVKYTFAISDPQGQISGDTKVYNDPKEKDKGVVTIGDGDHGVVTVTVTRPGDDRYNAWSGSFELTITEISVDISGIQFVDAEGNELTPTTDGWYTSTGYLVYSGHHFDEYPTNGHTGNDPKHWPDDWESEYYLGDGRYEDLLLCIHEDGTQGAKHGVNVGTYLVDSTAPTCTITYSDDVWGKVWETLSFGYYQAGATVTITAQDATSGVASIWYTNGYEWIEVPCGGEKEISTSFSISANFRGQVSFYAVDTATNQGAVQTGNTTIIVDNEIPVLETSYGFVKPEGAEGASFNLKDGIYYTPYATEVHLKIDERNFLRAITEDVNHNEEGIRDQLLVSGPVIKVDGKEVQVEWAENMSSKWISNVLIEGDGDHILEITFTDKSKNEMAKYEQVIRIDSKAPVVTMDEDPNGICGSENVSTVLTIEDHNFDVSNTTVTVTAVDIFGNPVDLSSLVVGAWTQSQENPDVYTAPVQAVDSGIYTVTVTSTDLAGNGESKAEATFTVDHIDPQDVTISYSTPLLEAVLSGITFGYYKPDVDVTITAVDTISGVNRFEWTYNRQEGASETNVQTLSGVINAENITFSADKSQATATFTLTADAANQFRGNITVNVYDNAGLNTPQTDDSWISVVDTKAPVGQLTWTDADQDVGTSHYYDDKAVATIRITEANFYAEDVVILDNGNAVRTSGWTQSGDTWTTTVTVDAEGDHVLTVNYTDRSQNVMEPITSETIVIDHTNPTLSVSIDADDARIYFNTAQTITVRIVEHNFRASDVKFLIESRDVTEASINAAVTYGQWQHNGDVHTIDLTFNVDANYTLDVEYQDLALRTVNDLPVQLFTVDQTAPTGLSVSYSGSLVDEILSGISFGFYNAPMTVTITAVDDTSGIDEFIYSYIKGTGVSSVNAQLLNDAISGARITRSGKTFTATFQIPKEVLTGLNQFNGTVEFTAFDRAENSTEMSDTKRIVVDNISPTASITYNTPAQEAEGVSYYADKIDCTITINEANFHSGDVVVTVTKDGVSYPVSPVWSDISVDSHTGRFTLSEDGDYIVTVSYADKSGNRMNTYTSNQLTLDTEVPVIQISDVVANSANKDEEYGFTITISDTNLDVASMNPVLTAVVQNENGVYESVVIDLGTPVAVVAGQTYTYTVENLTADAMYTLSYQVLDMAGNMTNQATLDDGETYDQVQFSINRSGSAFAYGDEYAENLVGQYYVYSVDEDVVIVEVNVDPIENYAVLLNGKTLVEGEDYVSQQTSNPGEWSKRSYIIFKELFEEEGEYSIIISSTDKAASAAYSDIKNLSAAFVVDQTAPVLTISGLETGGRYQTDEQLVTVIPTDEGGRLYSLKVIAYDSDGNPLKDENGEDISVRFEMSGEAFLTFLEENDGKITFTVPEMLNGKVRLICNDCAVNSEGETNECNELYERVTVSQNQLIIFYANTQLFVGSIAGLLALLLLIIILLKRKKDKKEQDAVPAA